VVSKDAVSRDVLSRDAAKFVQCAVIRQEELSPSIFRTTLFAPGIALGASPGQFVNIKCGAPGSFDPLLPRPFSFNRIDRESDTFAVLYRVVGRGTELLCRVKVGETLTALGPLGTGFVLPETGGQVNPDSVRRVLLVAGGMGIAPFYPLATALLARDITVSLLYGTRLAVDLADQAELAALGAGVLCCSEDRLSGHGGLVTEQLQATIDAGERFDLAYACGPRGMLSAVKQICLKGKLPLQLSLEEHMACGLGVCLGCTCERASGEGYWHVCTEGPVMWAEEVKL
jgi:dihydroorotate dehydrogenase electron transfer subunit